MLRSRSHLRWIYFILYSAICGTSECQVYIEGPAVGSICYGSTISLVCYYPNISDRRKYLSASCDWAVNGTRKISDGTTSIRTLNSTAARLDVILTREQFEDSLFYYSCYLVLYNGSRETSSDVEIDPPEHPAPPTLREPITTTPSTVTLEVDHRNTCFVNCTFQYEVKVHPAGRPMSTSTTTHSTNTFNVSGLSGSTKYRAEIVAVCIEESTIRSDPLNINFTMEVVTTTTVTPPPLLPNGTDPTTNPSLDTITTSLSTGVIAGIVVVCVVVILLTFLAGCGVGVIVLVVYQKSKQSTSPGSNEGTNYDEYENEYSIPCYVNDGKSVPMTTNPSYRQVPLTSDHSKSQYTNV